jgi:hypothetical protein
VSPCGIFDGEVAPRSVFVQYFGSLSSIIQSKLPTQLKMHAAVTRGHVVEAWELRKEMLFWVWGEHWVEKHSLFLSLRVISAYRACIRIYGPASYV